MKKNNKLINLIPYIFIILIAIILFIIGNKFIFIKKENNKHNKINLETENLNLNYGDKSKINAIYSDNNTTDNKIIWSSSDEEFVSIDEDGFIKVNKNESGKVTITASSEDGSIKESITLNIEKVENIINVTGLALNEENINLKYGESFQIYASVFPENATNKNVIYSVNNDLISIDQNGLIKVNKNEAGESLITVKTIDGNFSKTAKVTIEKVEKSISVTGVELDKKEINLNYNESYQLKATIKPSNATNKNLTWESSNSSLVSVTQTGLITVNQNITGQAIITVMTNDGNYKAQTKVNTTKKDTTVKVTGIVLNQKELNLKYQETYQLIGTIKPSNATDKNIIWTSSNPNLVSITETGLIKVIKNETGTVTITAKTKDGNYTATTKINTQKIDTTVNVASVTLNKTEETILLNNSNLTATLRATVYPENATNKNIIWNSSNPEVATVDNNGVVTAKTLGTTTITVTTEDGSKTASTTIYVKKNVIIVIGASQVTKMKDYKTKYTSPQNNIYKVSDNTLIYVEKSGSLIIYQTTDGFDTAINRVNKIASTKKEYVNFYVFFPLVGNTIKRFNCNELITTNEKMLEYVNNYNNSIKKLLDSGYKAKGYIVSMHPVKVSQSDSSTVVVNENKNSCKENYRSNRKYNYFNNVIRELTNQINPKYVKYIDTFNEIMTVTDIDKNYSYKITYNTSDGVHWNKETTGVYVNMMFNLTNEL